MIHQFITVQVPENRRVVIELPPEVPVGPAELELRVLSKNEAAIEVPPPQIDVAELPRYFDERAGEWRPVGRSGVVREIRSAE
jgi:hypothetical protein